MATFAGWSPCITGRLSFSQFGKLVKRGNVCNRASADYGGYVFGVVERTSQDGPLPAWMLRLFGQVPDTLYLFAFKVEEGDLPYERDHCDPLDIEPCADADGGASGDGKPGPCVVLRHDARAKLSGEILFLSKGKQAKNEKIKSILKAFNHNVAAGRVTAEVQEGAEEAAGYLDSARALLENLRQHLVADARGDKPTPAFGYAQAAIWRTGQVRIGIRNENLFTGEAVRGWQAERESGEWIEPDGYLLDVFNEEVEQRSRQIFFTIRDMAHQHYHHDPQSDLLTTAYSWSQSDDEKWRRETQYGLVRMAIALRRRDTAESFKRALGILAYADAFQRHMCGWVEAEPGKTKDCELRFAYDFTALRASIDASLKVRELRDAQSKQTLLFCFGVFITTLGIIVTGLRSAEVPVSAEFFADWLKAVTAQPLIWLVIAWCVAWAIDAAFIRLALRPVIFSRWIGGLSRFIDSTMGSIHSVFPRWFAYGSGLVIVASIVTLAVVASFFAGLGAMKLILGQ